MLTTFRSTKSYLICGKIGIFALPAVLVVFNICKSLKEFAPIIFFSFFVLPLLVALTGLFIYLTICAYKQSKNNNSSQTDIVSDVGYLMFCTLMCWLLLTMFVAPMYEQSSRTTEQKTEAKFLEDKNKINMYLAIAENSCEQTPDKFTACFARYLPNVSSFKDNVITTNDNKTYTFNINGKCEDNCSIEIRDKKVKENDMYMKINVIYNPSHGDFPWRYETDGHEIKQIVRSEK